MFLWVHGYGFELYFHYFIANVIVKQNQELRKDARFYFPLITI